MEQKRKENPIQYCTISAGQVFHNGKKIYDNTSGDPSSFLSDIYHSLGISYPKFYKMDNLAKTGYLAAEILLGGTAVDTTDLKREIGIAIMNSSSSIDADKKFNKSIADFASPSIFVYTLPNVVVGEISIRFKITGEGVVFIAPSFDTTFMYEYLRNGFENKIFDNCLFGWIDYNEKPEAFLAIIENIDFKAIDERYF
ncbi:MAG: hypothetical protein J6X26_00335, partial [Bacteroidales bacterium]|nr:hypothetical protein [Bacteroidales bacterium]